MEVKLDIKQDSWNTESVDKLVLSESRGGDIILSISGVDREIYINRQELIRAIQLLGG